MKLLAQHEIQAVSGGTARLLIFLASCVAGKKNYNPYITTGCMMVAGATAPIIYEFYIGLTEQFLPPSLNLIAGSGASSVVIALLGYDVGASLL